MNSHVAITCQRWDKEKRQVKDRELCEVVGLLEDRATRQYGDPNVRRLRNDFCNGRITFAQDRAGRVAIETLLRFEDEYLSAYVNLVCKVARSFWETNKRFKIELDDYIQEGCMALINAVCHYDGSSAFTSYLQSTIRRCFSTFIREQEELAGVSRSTKRLKKLVIRTMAQFDYNPKEAVEYLRREEEISDTAEEKVLDALYSTIALSPKYDVPVEDEELPFDKEAIQMSIEESGLTEIERELIDAYMAGDDKARSEMLYSGKINKTTGRPYTKQALSLAFKRACAKIKERLEARKVAA